MKLKYEVKSKNLCANCASKIEEALIKEDSIDKASLSFMTEKLKLEVSDDADIDQITKLANQIADKIEPGTSLTAI
ncbi:MAG: cation transporter [Anaerococcus sp.]|uniref:cation transporter n=1 Tax=Anaerococcus octavius TaxID=54007 RepID=UPI002352E9B7|nr:cation transporter [Anaerococcus octavius]MDU5535702.1 cation transporter [Anaerococcus sp.]